MNIIFQVRFDDNTIFQGNALKGDWNNMPEKNIKMLSYIFDKKQYVFKGCVFYNHLIKNHMTSKGNIISAIYILGQDLKKTVILKFDFLSLKVLRAETLIGEEWKILGDTEEERLQYKNQNISGWKQGII